MKRPLTEEQMLRKQYSTLYDLNQRLKNISECYYIGHDGMIYMKSLVPFTEVLIKLNDITYIQPFFGALIMPNRFFEFGKTAKKSKLTVDFISEKDEDGNMNHRVRFGQNDSELNCSIDYLNKEPDLDDDYREEVIHPKFYKRFFNLTGSDYVQFENQGESFTLSEDDVISLTKSNPLYIDIYDKKILLTRNLFLDIKADSAISLCRMCYQKIEDEGIRVFYMISHETGMYTSFTVFNVVEKI